MVSFRLAPDLFIISATRPRLGARADVYKSSCKYVGLTVPFDLPVNWSQTEVSLFDEFTAIFRINSNYFPQMPLQFGLFNECIGLERNY